MIRSIKDAEAFSALEGAEVVVGDFNDPETLAHALQGVERAFLLTNSSERAQEPAIHFCRRGAPRRGQAHC